MSRNLPGFYWDKNKKRYFRLSHSSQGDQPARRQPTVHPGTRQLRPFKFSDLRSTLYTAHKDALLQSVLSFPLLSASSVTILDSQLLSSQFALTDKLTRESILPLSGPVTAFQSVSHNGSLWNFAGNALGWFYSSHGQGIPWQPRCYLSSEISSICVSGTTCIATSFGPDCRILYVPLDLSVEVIHKIDSRVVHDVWTADLQGSRLVLGANQQAVMINDITVCASLQRFPTQSDVFALAQRDNILHAGLRNGRVLRFDTRLQRSNCHPVLDSEPQRGSITALKHLHDYQLIASFINGEISTFDLRFPSQTPLMTLTGNFNKHTVRLPLVTDLHEKFLFAAGQDNRIRLWSLLTGGPALDPGGACSTVFQQPFEHRVAALQVIEEKEGMSLLAASGTELYRYSLGHRSGICVN